MGWISLKQKQLTELWVVFKMDSLTLIGFLDSVVLTVQILPSPPKISLTMPHSKTYKKYNTTPTPELKAVEFYKGHTSERRVSTQSDRACKPEASRITWKH